jgi:hypothetical protein
MSRVPVLTFASVALAVVLLLPALRTGYLCDDDPNSLVDGWLLYHHLGLGESIVDEVKALAGQGRFFPLMIVLMRGTFHAFPTLAAYKAYLLAAVALNLLLFARLVRRLTGSAATGAVSVLTVAALFQFRIFDDPILAYHGFMQFVVLGLLLSLLAQDRYLTGASRLWLAAAVLAYLAVLLTYEVTYPLFLMHAALAVARGRRWKSAALTALPFAGTALACAALSVILRTLADSPINSPYQPNLDVLAWARTFGRQLFAALPLSYFLRHPHGALPHVITLLRSFPLLPPGAAFLLALVGLSRLRHEPVAERTVSGPGLVLLGLLLWALPGLLICLSPKYQALIVPGVGYLPVYAQYYGVGLLAAAGVRWAVRSRAGVAAVAAVLAAVIGPTYALNVAVADTVAKEKQVRDNIEAALDTGLLDTVPDGATLLLDNPHGLWHNDRIALCLDGPHSHGEYFYFLHSGKRVRVVARGHDLPGGGPLYEVRDEPGGVLLIRRGSEPGEVRR